MSAYHVMESGTATSTADSSLKRAQRKEKLLVYFYLFKEICTNCARIKYNKIKLEKIENFSAPLESTLSKGVEQ